MNEVPLDLFSEVPCISEFVVPGNGCTVPPVGDAPLFMGGFEPAPGLTVGLPQAGQNLTPSGKLAPQCLQNIVFPPQRKNTDNSHNSFIVTPKRSKS